MALVSRQTVNSPVQPYTPPSGPIEEIKRIYPQPGNIVLATSLCSRLLQSVQIIAEHPLVQKVALGALCYAADRYLQSIGWQKP